MVGIFVAIYSYLHPKASPTQVTNTLQLSQPQFGWQCLFVFYFQVGVEIRDELQLLAPSEFRHDIYREVSKKRSVIDTIRALGVIIWHRHISTFHKFSKVNLHTTFNLSFPNNQHILVLTIGYSIKLTVNLCSSAFNVIRATCSVTKIFMNYFLLLIYLQ